MILKPKISTNNEIQAHLGTITTPIQTEHSLTLHLMEVGTLEADDVLWEDPRVHVLSPNNIPLRVLLVVDGTVVIVTAGVELGGPGWDGLWPAHQNTAQHDVRLAVLICIC